jgi:hypothetical protein
VSHHLQLKRKIIMDFIYKRIKESGAKDASHINMHKLENLVMWNYGATRETARKLIDITVEVMPFD